MSTLKTKSTISASRQIHFSSLVLVACLAICCGLATAKLATRPAPAESHPLLPIGIGITLAGSEFGCDAPSFSNANPGVLGRDFTYNSEATLERLAEQGYPFVRIPFRWERLQPHIGKSLDEAEVIRLHKQVEMAARHGMHVVLDLHNYGRYRMATPQGAIDLVIDQHRVGKPCVTSEDFADLWWRIAASFRDAKGVIAYALMNEPHDMGGSDWKHISQAAVTSIRTADLETWILVAGDHWSNADRFSQINGPQAWISDPTQRTAYEAHCYFDRDKSGKYKLSYDDELQLDPQLPMRGTTRVREFLQWCSANEVQGFLGEFGVPSDDPRWNSLVAELLAATQEAGVPCCAWAAGEWWGHHALSLQPSHDPRQEAPSASIIRRFNEAVH